MRGRHRLVNNSSELANDDQLNRELHHRNLVALREVILEDKAIYMVFEYAEHDFLVRIPYPTPSICSPLTTPDSKSYTTTRRRFDRPSHRQRSGDCYINSSVVSTFFTRISSCIEISSRPTFSSPRPEWSKSVIWVWRVYGTSRSPSTVSLAVTRS